MREINFSVMSNQADFEATILRYEPLVKAFKQQTRIHVNIMPIGWQNGWSQVLNFGLYGKGPDVSEVGSTWVTSLAALQALRPIAPSEIAELGGGEAFFPPSWQANFLPGDPKTWGIPWVADVLLVYYWKDALIQAGITDATSAFATPQAMQKTLLALQQKGHEYPLAMMVHNSNRAMHIAVNWVWAAGGELMTPDGKQVAFAQEKALQGFRDYFGLLPFISPQIVKETFPSGFFQSKKAMVMIDGPRFDVIGRQTDPTWREKIGLAPLFTKTWVGGMNFVLWKHSPYDQESLAWIRFLLQQAPRNPIKLHDVMLYAHRQAFEMPNNEDEHYQDVCRTGLTHGCPFPATGRGWGSIEDRLNKAINNIWPELFENSEEDPSLGILQYIEPLARRLNMTQP
jgi:multiple sugar transport system substrate-binding protein